MSFNRFKRLIECPFQTFSDISYITYDLKLAFGVCQAGYTTVYYREHAFMLHGQQDAQNKNKNAIK